MLDVPGVVSLLRAPRGEELLSGQLHGDYPLPGIPPSGAGRARPQATFPAGVLIVWQSHPSYSWAHTVSSAGVVPMRPCSVAAFCRHRFLSDVLAEHWHSFSASFRQSPLHAGPKTSTHSTDAQRKYRDMGRLA